MFWSHIRFGWIRLDTAFSGAGARGKAAGTDAGSGGGGTDLVSHGKLVAVEYRASQKAKEFPENREF